MDALFYLLKSAAVLAFFYLVYIFLLRKETHFKAHRFFLITGLISSFIIPSLYFTRTVYVDVVERTTTVSEKLIPLATGTAIETNPGIDWWWVAFVVYCVGVAFFSLRFLKQLFSLIYILRTNNYSQVNGFRYVKVEEKIAPFSFFNYIVYNPQLHSENELKMILHHERAHAFQWHSADIILSNVLIILQWPNPLAWFYKKSVEENLEFLADNATASSVPSKIEYQLALVKASSAHFTPALTTNFYKSFIKKRIIMLNKRTSKRHHLLKLATVIPFIALFLWSFNVKENTAYNILPASSDTEIPTAEEIETLGAAPTMESEEVTESLAVAGIPEEPTSISVNEAIAISNTASEASPIIPGALAIQKGKFEIKINKNTSEAELKKMKTDLKQEHGINLSYNTKRNSNNEIVSIQMEYSGNGNNGNYSISDDDGISEFIFYVDEDGGTGFYSEEMEARRAERLAKREVELALRQKELASRVADRERERELMREEIRVEREAMREEMTKKRKEMRDRMRERRKSIIIERDDDDGGSLFEYEDDDDRGEVREYIFSGSGSNEGDDTGVYVYRGGSGATQRAYVYSHGKGDHAVIIDKDTTDETLEKIKTKLAKDGIQFKYSKVKRNSKGEITGIRINVKNNREGHLQNIQIKSDDDEPIEEILISLDN